MDLYEHNNIPSLRISTASACNHRCAFCQVGSDYGSDFGRIVPAYASTYMGSIERFYKAGVRHFSLTGGEPLVNPQVTFPVAYLILRLLQKEGRHRVSRGYLRLNTNGVFIEDHIDHMSMFDLVKISLHSLNEGRYKTITGSRTPREDLKKVRHGITLLEGSEVPIRIQTVVSRDNYEEVYDIVKFCEEQAGIVELKLLDLSEYTKLWRQGEVGHSYWRRNFVSLEELESSLADQCSFVETAYSVGCYGNPMNVYRTPRNLLIRVRRSDRGAFYGPACKNCPVYGICGDGHCNLELGPNRLIKVCRPKEGKVFRVGEEIKAVEYFSETQFKSNKSLHCQN